MKLRIKNKYGAETNPVILAVVLWIIATTLAIGSYNVLGGYLSHQESKAKALAGEVFDNIILNAQSWEGIMTDDRNKRNIYLLKDWSNTIEVYSYKEIFEQKLHDGAVKKISTPVIKFDRYYTFSLPMWMEISFEGTDLATENKTEVALQVDAPHWELMLFDVDGNFKKFTEADKNFPQSADNRSSLSKQQFDGKTYIKEYWRWDVANEVQYWRIIAGCTLPSCKEYEKMDIWVKYKRDIIGHLSINKEKNKILFVWKRWGNNEASQSNNTCGNDSTFYEGSCLADYTYYQGNQSTKIKECTFYKGDCHKNNSIMTKPDGSSCRWSPWVCNPI